MAERKAFNFYASYWHQMKLLNNKQKLELFDSICGVQFLEININDVSFKDPICTLVWAGIKHSVASSLYGFINKNKGLDNQIIEPLAKGGVKAPCQQEEEKGEEKGKVQYVYSKFYDSEIKKTDNPKYEQFVKYLFGNNKLKIKLAGVLSITNQLKADDFEKVLESCEINKKKIGDIVTKIENDTKYYKGKKSLYRTLLNWSEDRFTK